MALPPAGNASSARQALHPMRPAWRNITSVNTHLQTLGPSARTRVWSFFKDSGLATIGKVYNQLPGSTADLERHFSGAQFVGEGRERLTSTHLFQEVFVRENRRALKNLQAKMVP